MSSGGVGTTKTPTPAYSKTSVPRRGLAAQQGVAVRVAAKAVDDGLVAHFKAPGVFHARLIKQDHRFCVHQSGLAVHVGHVGKAALRQGQRGLRKGAGRGAPSK